MVAEIPIVVKDRRKVFNIMLKNDAIEISIASITGKEKIRQKKKKSDGIKATPDSQMDFVRISLYKGSV